MKNSRKIVQRVFSSNRHFSWPEGKYHSVSLVDFFMDFLNVLFFSLPWVCNSSLWAAIKTLFGGSKLWIALPSYISLYIYNIYTSGDYNELLYGSISQAFWTPHKIRQAAGLRHVQREQQVWAFVALRKWILIRLPLHDAGARKVKWS